MTLSLHAIFGKAGADLPEKNQVQAAGSPSLFNNPTFFGQPHDRIERHSYDLSGIFTFLPFPPVFLNLNKKTPFPELWPEKAFYELLKIVKLKVSLDVIWLGLAWLGLAWLGLQEVFH